MRSLKQHIIFACGWTALGVGVVGIAVPVLPTVPFVLLAAACFLRSSKRWHGWLVRHPVFGPHIAGYLAGRGLRRRAKVLALATLWASVLLSAFLVVPILAADVAMIAVAAAVSVYLLRLPTASTEDEAPHGETLREIANDRAGRQSDGPGCG